MTIFVLYTVLTREFFVLKQVIILSKTNKMSLILLGAVPEKKKKKKVKYV